MTVFVYQSKCTEEYGFVVENNILFRLFVRLLVCSEFRKLKKEKENNGLLEYYKANSLKIQL